MTILPNATHKHKEIKKNLSKNAPKKTPTKRRFPHRSHQFYYGENIPMAWGGPQHTVCHHKSHSFTNMLDTLKKITTKR